MLRRLKAWKVRSFRSIFSNYPRNKDYFHTPEPSGLGQAGPDQCELEVDFHWQQAMHSTKMGDAAENWLGKALDKE